MKWAPLLLFLCCCNLVSGQDDQLLASWIEYAKSEVVVIAPAGLNLRDKPTVKSEILRAVPFGEKVKIIGSGHYGRDTVGAIDFYYSAPDRLAPISTPIPISGYWLKVDYQGTIGYMFTAYLDVAVNTRLDGDESMNRDFILLFPYNGCFSNYTYHAGYHWYGYYKTGTGISVKKIDVSFYNLIDQELIAGNTKKVVSCSDNKFLQFIIGSKEPIALPVNNSKIIQGALYDEGTGTIEDSILQQSNISLQFKPKTTYPNLEKLVLIYSGKQQIIDLPDGIDSDGCYLVCCGDLDGDKKEDYIFGYGAKFSKTILYLSKPAEKGKLLKPVAVFYSGYCC